MSGDMSASDKAIKRSAEQEPEYSPRASAKRMPDSELRDKILRQCDAPLGYTHVHVIDYPGFDPRFTWYRANFYYENDEDPTTSIKSFVITKDQIQ